MLGAYPDIFCNGNIFKAQKMQLFWPDRELQHGKRDELMKMRDENPEGFADLVFSSGFGKPHVGFKMFQGQQDDLLFRFIGSESIRKIVLYRRNVLANYASALSARETNQYSVESGGQRVETKVHFSIGQFVRFHNRYVGFYRAILDRLNSFPHNYLFLDYENLNEAGVLGGVATFIGASPNTNKAERQYRRLSKQGTNNIVARFENKDEVSAFLERHGLMCWAHEGPASLDALPDNKISIASAGPA